MSRRALTRNEAGWLSGELNHLFGPLTSDGPEAIRSRVRSKVERELLRHGVPQSEQAVRGMVRRSGPLAYQQHIRQE